MRLRLECQLNDYLNDVQEVARAFCPPLEFTPDAESYLKWECVYRDGNFLAKISSDILGSAEKALPISDSDISVYKKLTKRFLKNFLYDFLSERLNIRLPYGSLTGVRPTKLYYELSAEKDALRCLIDDYKVTQSRAELIKSCVENQRGIINTDPDAVAIFLNVPFCPTRCSYCSFISTEVGRVKKELPRYVECVTRELEAIKSAVAAHGKRVTSVYVGGGTPVSIGADNLNKILSPLSDCGVELTVEAGRPDVIDEEVAEVLKVNSVTRVSLNPQTFKQATLDAIGRRHTVEDIYRAYPLVKNFSVNMDLIAGLPDEDLSDFVDSLSKTLSFRPDNITVHTLSLKRGSVMTQSGAVKHTDGAAGAMCDYARDTLLGAGYVPYYMYRQKNMADNLENVGYSLPGKQCKYNIDMMEESITVLGAGAGAMSKYVFGDKITRLSSPKGFREYSDRIEEIIASKRTFFERG